MTEAAAMADDHRDALRRAAGEDGYLRELGTGHLALFRPGGSTLLVEFDDLRAVEARPGGLPWSAGLHDKRGWTTLSILARGRDWYRDDAVHDFFDDLTDDGTFDAYDNVIFFGAGIGAYGAAAHSVAAPGATVFLIVPYATLDRDVTPWERRFRSARSLPFGPRYGNAARMVDAARRVYVVTDPRQHADAMHASLFTGDHIVRLPAANGGPDVRTRLERIGILDRLVAGAESGALTPLRFARLWRARRRDEEFLLRLLRRLEDGDRPWLTAVLAGFMLRGGKSSGPARRRLNAALFDLADSGREAPRGLSPEPPRLGERILMAGE